MEPDGNHAPRSSTAKILAIASRSRWLVPLVALAAIALSLLELDIGPVGWNKPVAETAGRAAGLTGEQSVCICLALIMLIYWRIRERQEAAADLTIAAAWLTGVPGMTIVAGWIVTGTRIVFATLKRKVYEQIRSEGHAEGRQEANAEWQAWWQRRTATGEFVSDPNDLAASAGGLTPRGESLFDPATALPYNRLRRAPTFAPWRAAKYLQEVPLWQSNPSASA